MSTNLELLNLARGHAAEVANSTHMTDWLGAFGALVMTSPDAEVADLIRTAFRTMTEELPASSLWAIEVSEALRTRLTGARVLFGLEETPEIVPKAGESVHFPGARGLQTTLILGYEPYVDPVLLASAPYIHGISTARAGGTVVILFGEPLAGVQQPAAPIQLFRSRLMFDAALGGVARPSLGSTDVEAALRWWVTSMNDLLGILLDPAKYVGQDGYFDARPHLGALLSFERLFACIQTLLMYTHQDEFVRRTLMFDALDLLEGLGVGDYRATVRISKVDKKLERLRGQLPGPVANLFLTRCEAAADALRSATDGFFIKARRRNGSLRVKREDGTWEDVSIETALADYLWVLRNSTHSFGRIARSPRQASLLGAHTGELPAELSDVPILHVLGLLVDPTSLQP